MKAEKETMKKEIKAVIYKSYPTENACAVQMGWARQRLNKITNATKEPTVSELNEIAKATNRKISEIADIFLRFWSPNGQQ